jgi:hypothetical protein
LIAINPARRLHAAGFYTPSLPVHSGANVFTDEEFAVLMLTLSDMADEDIKHERTLLMIASVYYLRLKPSEIDSLGGDLTISALRLMRDGTYDLVEEKIGSGYARALFREVCQGLPKADVWSRLTQGSVQRLCSGCEKQACTIARGQWR